jgi:hypothetical protein
MDASNIQAGLSATPICVRLTELPDSSLACVLGAPLLADSNGECTLANTSVSSDATLNLQMDSSQAALLPYQFSSPVRATIHSPYFYDFDSYEGQRHSER